MIQYLQQNASGLSAVALCFLGAYLFPLRLRP
jgi:hypothetical protein